MFKTQNFGITEQIADLSDHVQTDNTFAGTVRANDQLMSFLIPSARYVLDCNSMSYSYMEPSVEFLTGYAADEFLQGGTEFLFSRMHPDDREVVVGKISKKINEETASRSAEDILKMKFAYNYRLLRPDATYMHVLQSFVITGTGKRKKLSIHEGVLTDITMQKESNRHILSVTSVNSENEVERRSYHFQSASAVNINRREIEVLRLLFEGSSSKLIADKLGISINTVHNHRRSLLEKTASANTPALINYAITNGLLS
jgi:DNA-binding CsgD family transcriptional regulator